MGLFNSSSRPTDPEPLRVLVIAPDASRRAWVDRALKQDSCRTDVVNSAAEALSLLVQAERRAGKAPGGVGPRPGQPRFDAAVIDADDCTPATLKLVGELGARQIASVLLCGSVSFDQALAAMRAGASDIVGTDVKPKELIRRLRAAARSSTFAHPGELDRHEPRTAGSSGLGKATPSGALTNTDPLASFRAAIANELDVETLLRQALEFVLAKVGPTNAAIFLPGSSGDYQLGAYVNYSAPKDTAEVMLDHLANVCAPRLDRTVGVIELCDAKAVEHTLGDGLEWLSGQRVLAFACRNEGETLAVFMIFRDALSPFPAGTSGVLTGLRDAFGQQLARVIRIHHRHLPRDKWGALGDGLDAADDDNMAA